jgi:hypothetical protein
MTHFIRRKLSPKGLGLPGFINYVMLREQSADSLGK